MRDSLLPTDSLVISQPMRFSGSTATFILFFSSPELDSHLNFICGNVGDSLAFRSSRNEDCELDITLLTEEHRPGANEKEKERIEKAGGFVHKGRVDGVLAVSRSFGDLMYKKYPKEEEGEEEDLVVCSPSQTFPSPISIEDEFIIIASDGLWDSIQRFLSIFFTQNYVCF